VEQIGAFVQKHGVDKTEFLAVLNSFAINTKVAQAKTLTTAFRVDGVPTLGIQGRYLTIAQPGEQILAVADFLIQKVRQEGKGKGA
jgi:protein dithiol oxidoreductase (disulfide-forming)